MFVFCMVTVLSWMLLQVAGAAEPLKVAIIDSGLDRTDPSFRHVCETGHYNFVTFGYDTDDELGHGSYIAGLIEKFANNQNYCLLIYKVMGDSSATMKADKIPFAIREAVRRGAQVINMSLGGDGFLEQEYLAIKENPKVTFVVAAGNDGKELGRDYKYYPASYGLPNVIVVGAQDFGGTKLSTSNYGSTVNVWEVGIGPLVSYKRGTLVSMSGTSVATAIHTARIVSVKGLK